jgi:hypothetical protein
MKLSWQYCDENGVPHCDDCGAVISLEEFYREAGRGQWCDKCFDRMDAMEARRTEIDKLMQAAESDEQWAHICKLEADFFCIFGEQA